jgi:transposase InsO family protein
VEPWGRQTAERDPGLKPGPAANEREGRLQRRPLHGGPADAENGFSRGDPGKRVSTTIAIKGTPCPLDHVNRQFRVERPNVLWVCDFTYVATWTGFVYARSIVGWRVAHAGFVLDALEQAVPERGTVMLAA